LEDLDITGGKGGGRGNQHVDGSGLELSDVDITKAQSSPLSRRSALMSVRVSLSA
jgi:hypothetical protein